MMDAEKQMENDLYTFIMQHHDYNHMNALNVHDVRFAVAKFLIEKGWKK